MRHTISQRVVLAGVLALAGSTLAHARPTAAATGDPFGKHHWHFETGFHSAFEAWNYNVSHEELYGLSEGLTYGLRDGLVLTATQHVYYVSQRANDSWLLGLTAGFRGRIYRRGRTQAYIEGDVGISDAAIAVPPRGTRFNYVVTGSSGLLIRVSPRVHAVAALEWIHVSNNSLKGPGRNPDTEAVGPRIGLVIGL
jgi:hypothetical protein